MSVILTTICLLTLSCTCDKPVEPEAPATPSGITLKGATQTTLAIQWDLVEGATGYADACKQEEEKYTGVLKQGITDALYASQNLERSYRELDSFFKTCGSDKVKNLRIINVLKEDIADADSGFAQEVEEILRNGFPLRSVTIFQPVSVSSSTFPLTDKTALLPSFSTR